MPISSTEVSNILQAQIGMFSTSAQYAQAMSAQYGFQSLGGMGVNDPRAASPQQSLLAGNIAGGAIRGAGYAMGGLSLAAGFGLAPRILDPFFSMPMHLGSMGYRLGGLGGALGMGGMALAGGMAAASAAGYASDQMLSGAQGRAVLNSQIGGMFPGMGVNQIGSLSAMVEGMHRQGIGGINELTALMRQGSAAGTLQTGNIAEFQSSFQKLVGNVRQIANVLNSSINEAHQALVQVRAMGVSSDRAVGFVTTAKGLGLAGGASPQEMLMAAGQGSQLARQAGIDPETGAVGAMRTAGLFSMVESQRLIEGITAGSQGKFTSAAFRFLGSRRGRPVLGAIMTPDGEYDPEVASSIAAGSMTPREIRRLSARNLSRPGARDAFRARRQELAAEFVSEFGPEGVIPAVRDISAESGMPETMRARLTGLNRRDFVALEQLSGRASSLNQRLSQEAINAFKEGQRQLGVGDVLGVAADKFLGPIRERFRQMGANLTQTVARALDEAANEFVQSPPPRADPRKYSEKIRTSLLTGRGLSISPIGSSGIFPVDAAGVGGSVRSMVPPAFRMLGAGVSPGTSLSELPGFGFATQEYNPFITGGIAALAPIGPLGGSAVTAAGGLIDSAGAGVMRSFRTPFGMSGRGLVSGSAQLGGLGLRGVGMGLRGLGRVAGPLALPAFAADLLFNVGPEANRALGRQAYTSGGVTGTSERFLRYLQEENILPAESFRTATLGMGGLTQQAAQQQGLIPLSSSYSANGGGAGSQTFVTPKGVEHLDMFLGPQAAGRFYSGDYSPQQLSKAQEILNANPDHPQKAIPALVEEGFSKEDAFRLVGRRISRERNEKAQIGALNRRDEAARRLLGENYSRGDLKTLFNSLDEQGDPLTGLEGYFAQLLDSRGLNPEDAGPIFNELFESNEEAVLLQDAAAYYNEREVFLTEAKESDERARRAGSMLGVSGLDTTIGKFVRSGGDLRDPTGRRAAFEQLQRNMEGLSPRDRQRLGRMLSGTAAGDILGTYAYNTGRIRSVIGKSRDIKKIFPVITRTGDTPFNLTRDDLRFIKSGEGQMSTRLEAYLQSGAEGIMGLEAYKDAPEGRKDALENTLLKGLRDIAQGNLEGKGYLELERQISTTYDPISPASGKPGRTSDQMKQLESVLDQFIAKFNNIVGQINK